MRSRPRSATAGDDLTSALPVRRRAGAGVRTVHADEPGERTARGSGDPRRRWELALGAPATGTIAAPHLADFTEAGAPPAAKGTVPAGAIVAQSRFAPALAGGTKTAGVNVWTNGGRVAAVRLASAMSVDAFGAGGAGLETLHPVT